MFLVSDQRGLRCLVTTEDSEIWLTGRQWLKALNSSHLTTVLIFSGALVTHRAHGTPATGSLNLDDQCWLEWEWIQPLCQILIVNLNELFINPSIFDKTNLFRVCIGCQVFWKCASKWYSLILVLFFMSFKKNFWAECFLALLENIRPPFEVSL